MPAVSINGTEIFYQETGVGLPAVVMHGGLGLDLTYLHPWLDPLGDILHLVYYDHRGNGRSGRPPRETITFEQLCADADALREHLGFEQIAVMGHSLGGFVALEYALRFPRQLSHLILLNTAPHSAYQEEVSMNVQRRNPGEEILRALGAPPPQDDAEMRSQFEMILPLYFHSYDPVQAGRLVADTVYSAVGYGRNPALLAEFDVVPRLGEIKVPTLIVAGDDDFICPPSQSRIMQGGIANSELVIVEGSGHFSFFERPDLFFPAVRDWLNRTPG